MKKLAITLLCAFAFAACTNNQPEDNKNNQAMLDLVTLTTLADGKTEKVKRFDLKKTYEIYEVDAGDYRYIYDISDVNGGTKYGLLVDTWKPDNNKTGIGD